MGVREKERQREREREREKGRQSAGVSVVDFRDVAHARPHKARVQKPKPLVKRSEIRQNWMPMASQSLYVNESKDGDDDVSQTRLHSESTAVASGAHEASGTREQAQQDQIAATDQDSESTEFSGMTEDTSDSTYSYESEEEGEWDLDFREADDDYDSFQEALAVTPRQEDPSKAATTEPTAALHVAPDANHGADHKTPVHVSAEAESMSPPISHEDDVIKKTTWKSDVLKKRSSNIMAMVLKSKRIQQVKPDHSTAVTCRSCILARPIDAETR